jgi:transposase-like protein
MRVVALIACGTRALLGAAIGPLADGEQKLAATLTGCLGPGMLLLADRGFWSLALWQACAAAGADLLWRVKSDIRLPVRQPLPDGSWLSVVNGTREAHRRNMRNANRRSRGSRLPQEEGPLPGDVTVRVIEFLITLSCEDGTTRTERYRAVTTLLDWRRYPAADLAAAYARRWGIESAYREAKSYLAGGRVLRSRTPGLARQEAWALLITYQAIRALICHAAAGTDPGRLSFTTALHAARRTLASPAATLAAAGSEILANPSPAARPAPAPAPSPTPEVPRAFRTAHPLGWVIWKGKVLTRAKKSFSPEFRDEAVKMVIETSRPIARVAKELGINEGTLGNWVGVYRREHAGEEPPLTVTERARLRELERETRELKMENEFLKKAAAYFARDHR